MIKWLICKVWGHVIWDWDTKTKPDQAGYYTRTMHYFTRCPRCGKTLR